MANKNRMFFKLDFLSSPPNLRIFGNKNFKTTWSSIISIILIISSLTYLIYAFTIYLKFDDPNIVYIKESVKEKKLSVNLNETLLMFRINDDNKGIINKREEVYLNAYINYFDYKEPLNLSTHKISLEKCELGNNINMKFQDSIKEYENNILVNKINDYYCINEKDAKQHYLYYEKNKGYSFLSLYIYFSNDTEYTPKNTRIYLILENDYIDHYNKENPIFFNYVETFTSNLDDNLYEVTTFSLDYLEYETDDGIFIKNENHDYGIRYSGETQGIYLKNNEKHNNGRINIQINKNTYEKFKRNYSRLPGFLANIESIIHLLYIIAKFIANIIARKKMTLDLVRSLLDKKNENDKEYIDHFKRTKTYHQVFGKSKKPKKKNFEFSSSDNLKESIEQKDITHKIKENKNKEKKIINKVITKNFDKNIDNELKMKKVNVWTIIKSYFLCSKDNRTKLVNICHETILRELSIDKILIKLFKLEKIYYLLSNKHKAKIQLMEIKEFKDVNEFLKKYFIINPEEKEKQKRLSKGNINISINLEDKKTNS